ncbi:unannotated protein [freshwater metagenome]|uniref:Unannotated protein n=1 Tax=freshwater metagenome TaxID=449393 RepID=A0A6J7DVQ6_9ZZZZ
MIAFPEQPTNEPWPSAEWRVGEPAADVDRAEVDDALRGIREKGDGDGVSLATLAVHRGRIVAEQYGPDTDADTTLVSWSMAKTVTQAVFGMLVGDGLIDIDQPAAVPEFADTPKAGITVRHLLAMKSGLEFIEDYVDDTTSHCLDMLFGAGIHDHAHYAASQQLLHAPGELWNYASGTTNILARIAGDIIGGGEAGMRAFLEQRLFAPLGMRSAQPKFDDAGTFVGSSYLFATARDFARFGYLYLRDGVWDQRRLLPSGWVDSSRTEVAIDPDHTNFGYGAHCWIWRDQPGSLAAHGYEGQYTVVVPERDLVVVHLGKVPAAARPALVVKLSGLINAFPTIG